MPKCNGAKSAKCPYYLGDDKMKITCEGCHYSFNTWQLFRTINEKKAYKDKYCDGNYQECRQFFAVERKYNELLAKVDQIRKQKNKG